MAGQARGRAQGAGQGGDRGGGSAPASRLLGVANSANRPPAATSADIHAHLLRAITDQRLPPGTRLTEIALVEAFNLGRRAVAEALQRLSWEGLVTLHPNRGAAVAAPSAEEARAIFAAREAIEAGTTEAVARRGDAAACDALTANLEAEHRARHAGRLREAVILSGGFHVLMAELSGNPILAAQVRLLVARTSLVVALFENRGALACWHDDHQDLLRLIRARRHRAAASLMRRHLADIAASFALDRAAAEAFDVRRALVRGAS
jgi:DNA-binding GntR family transcriptional regulator